MLTTTALVVPKDLLATDFIKSIYKQRHRVFVDDLQWRVTSFDRMETDNFDEVPYVHYAILRSFEGRLLGSMRLLSTTGNYMLNSCFNGLLDHPAPRDEQLWEISRFTVEESGATGGTFGLGTLILLKSVIAFARGSGIKAYITVTSGAIERLLRRARLDYDILGKEREIGDGYLCTAVRINMTEGTFKAIERSIELAKTSMIRRGKLDYWTSAIMKVSDASSARDH